MSGPHRNMTAAEPAFAELSFADPASADPASADPPSAVLGIETSCDETAAAVVKDGFEVLSSVVSSQVSLHRKYGGVVPEVASRAHIEQLLPVVDTALREADISARDIAAVAATAGPGLVGALLVGVSAAKAFSLAWGVPFIAVNHLEGHIYGAFLEEPDIELPLVALLVSGGHTMLIEMQDFGDYRLLGQTCDDAAGEAFDKVARLLALGYPGGPAIERLAVHGDPTAIEFPRPMLKDGLDFSFSGLKTAVANYVRSYGLSAQAGGVGAVSGADVVAGGRADAGAVSGADVAAGGRADAGEEAASVGAVADVAASFQEAVVDVLVAKAVRAVQESNSQRSTPISCACLAGGVAANSVLRERFAGAMSGLGVRSFIPSRAMCTDNAAMIAAAGWGQFRREGASELTAPVNPAWQLAMTR